ncbi:protein MFI isoform X1 [Bufo gargarizans]|uniref:protein MFI isoform X1 n=1 Tax=Bufo gargarizans TaxID=30331 RepID=UPI001CF33AFB|nr:protein MFI isoform X1 [Bufo gargarizans]
MMEDMRDPATSDPDIYAMEEDRAARVIQKAFRRLLDVNVFRYFKNLLSFKGQGDPKLLLKCINPREAGLIDAAAGVHVRFRLGGTKFPPNIYYKLFTHRPIVDMCANSPKDYTKQSVKQPLPRQVHNHGVFPEEERRGWYTRVENNGWRLLAVRLPDGLDEVTAADKKKRTPFSHSKLQRKQEVSLKQKQRKIEWMRKMYYEGSLRARTTEPSTAVLVQRATEGVLQSVEQRGPQAVLDWEVDELLNWTNALNYDEYINSWKAMGTSKSSCAFTGTTLVRSPYDLYEFSQLSSPLSLTTSEEEAE